MKKNKKQQQQPIDRLIGARITSITADSERLVITTSLGDKFKIYIDDVGPFGTYCRGGHG